MACRPSDIRLTRRALLGAAAAWCGCGVAGPPSIRVLAASSVASVLPQVAVAFEDSEGDSVSCSFDGTSRLATQLRSGAPCDWFLSADEAWMEWATQRGLIRPQTVFPLLSNRLVVAVPSATKPTSLHAALGGRVGMASDAVPAGRYGREALQASDQWRSVEPRVVRANRVRTVLAWLARGEIDCGVVYATDVLVEPRVRVAHTFPEHSHTPIRYLGGVAHHAMLPDRASAFAAFCRSAGRSTFEEAGFSVLDTP